MLKGKNLNLEVNFLEMIKFLNEIIDEPEYDVAQFKNFEKSYPIGQKVIIDCETFWLSEKKLKHKILFDLDQLKDKVEIKGIIESYTKERFNNNFPILIKWEDNSRSWVPHSIISKI
jgi:hypothetical protein